MEKIIIAAVAENRVIGKNGEIPWHIPEDLQHFKEETTGSTVVMGRKTFQSLPDSFTPLPDRENIVLTRSDFSPQNESVKLANSLDEAWKIAENEKIYVIGGAGVYEQTLDKTDRMILTEIHEEYEGDTFFPKFSKEKWREVEREEHEDFDFAEYERV
jgi:dihydrofolate reductase